MVRWENSVFCSCCTSWIRRPTAALVSEANHLVMNLCPESCDFFVRDCAVGTSARHLLLNGFRDLSTIMVSVAVCCLVEHLCCHITDLAHPTCQWKADYLALRSPIE